jgi:hypothetical protein
VEEKSMLVEIFGKGRLLGVLLRTLLISL